MNDLSLQSRLVGRLTSAVARAGAVGVHGSIRAVASHPTIGDVDVYVKALSGKRIANELIAAAIAEQLGLNVPACFAVEVGSALNHDHTWSGRAYCFASVRVEHSRSLSESALLANPSTAVDFYSTNDWQAIVLLDALVANSDRTSANLLLDSNDVLWAVDHDAAFGGDWDVMDLQPLRHSTNLLIRHGEAFLTQRQRRELLDRVQLRPSTFPTNTLISGLPEIGLLTVAEADALCLYISERWRNLDELLRLALYSQH